MNNYLQDWKLITLLLNWAMTMPMVVENYAAWESHLLQKQTPAGPRGVSVFLGRSVDALGYARFECPTSGWHPLCSHHRVKAC